MSIVKVGQFFFNSTAANNTTLQIIGPTENVSGAVIRMGTLHLYGKGVIYLITGAAVPGTINVNTPIIICHDSPQASEVVLPYSIELAPGKGLWLRVQDALSGGGVNVSYDLYSA